jgi:hypothetical protein
MSSAVKNSGMAIYLLTGTKSLARLWRECNMTIRLSKFLSSLRAFLVGCDYFE